jgi:hypothetical protein
MVFHSSPAKKFFQLYAEAAHKPSSVIPKIGTVVIHLSPDLAVRIMRPYPFRLPAEAGI